VEVDPVAYENIKLFMKNKNNEHDLFDLINAGTLNDYLRGLMDGLSAKVFRT
jgi:DNA topoisomerase I